MENKTTIIQSSLGSVFSVFSEDELKKATDKGKRIVAIAGKINNPGIIEVPEHATLQDIINLAGGILNNSKFKAAQLGIPFGGFITSERLDEELFGENQKWIFSNQGDSNIDSIDFTMEIENIGLNTVRKVYLEAESELFNKKEIFELCNQSNIEKSQTKKKEFIITNVSKGTYKIEITVYYQDLLKNWYKQKVHLTISVTNIYDSKNHDRNQINSVIVDDEEMLSKAPTFVKKIKKS